MRIDSVFPAKRQERQTHEVKPKTETKTKARHQRKKPFIVAENKKLNIYKFTPHDLRRTCATMISQQGFVDEIVDSILAHL